MQLQRPTRLKETGLTPTAVLTVSLQQALAGQTISSRYDMPLLEVSLGRRDSATLLSSLAALPLKPTINDFIMMAGLGPLATEAEVVRVLGGSLQAATIIAMGTPLLRRKQRRSRRKRSP